MKVPENFNASATKKIDPLEAAINGNFSQKTQKVNSVSLKNSSSETREGPSESLTFSNEDKSPVTEKASVSENVKSQIFNAKTENSEEGKSEKPLARREVKEKFLVSMSKGERSVFKAFCAMQNVSMNHFVMCAMDYFKEDLENGKVSLSAHSYKRKEV